MPAWRHRRKTRAAIERQRVLDAAAIARRTGFLDVPESWPPLPDPRGRDDAAIKRMLDEELSSPDHPRNWHRRALELELRRPRVVKIYDLIRRAIWNWGPVEEVALYAA